MIEQKILLLGGSGMLGSTFRETQGMHFTIIAPSREACDVCVFAEVLDALALYEPDCVLNMASFTDVASSEGTGIMEAYSVNALAAQNIAKAAGAFGIPLIHISTDYVFDGEKSSGYFPNDTPNPINNYGMSKYLGEVLIRREYHEAIIVRTSALYGGPLYGEIGWKSNFMNSLLITLDQSNPRKMVHDQYMIPTSCIDLSQAIRELLQDIESYEGEILHLVNSNDEKVPVSWYDFALELKEHRGDLPSFIPITLNEYESTVKRPKNSTLENPSSIQLPHWKEGLKRYFTEV